jgi:acyl-CoA thioester hydrolase
MFSRRSGEPSLDLSHLAACDCEPEELRALFAPFRFELDVSCEDTDLSGAVYHANYLRFFGRARASWVGPAAFAALYARANVRFVIRGVALRFRRPARFGDRLEIVTRSCLPTPHTLQFEHVARLAGSELSVASGQVSAACVNAEDQPIPIPIAELVRIRREFGLPIRPTAAAER